MIELIKQILAKWGCMHQWQVHDESRVFHDEKDKKPYAIRHTLICTKCGKIKQIKL